jgi:hypothetical protein
MVIQTFSPSVQPAGYHRMYPSPPQASSWSGPRKRKRVHRDDEDSLIDVFETEHITKKQRDEYVPLTPTSPPFHSTTQPISTASHPSYAQAPAKYTFTTTSKLYDFHPNEQTRHPASDALFEVPSHNLLLHEVHLNSRVFQQNQKRMESEDMDVDMWEEEEEVVADRYAAMNKLLGSRRERW